MTNPPIKGTEATKPRVDKFLNAKADDAGTNLKGPSDTPLAQVADPSKVSWNAN
jgi:hypothetical protein